MNSIVDILCRAKVIYASAPSHAEPPFKPEPGTRCVLYAIARAGSDCEQFRFDVVVDNFSAVIGTDHIAKWNAEHTTEEVLAAWDRAIAAQRLVVPPLQRAERHVPVEA